MGVEIERKFLVRDDTWRAGAVGHTIRQGYLSCDPSAVVRVRICRDKGYLTVKGLAAGLARPEFEYDIPLPEAEQLLTMCGARLIEKTRYEVVLAGLRWEVDVFSGENAGLVVAECELESVDQEISHPAWLGDEVSDDPRYANSNLATNPFTTW